MKPLTKSLTLIAILTALISGVGCEMERRVIKKNPWQTMFENSEWSSAGGTAAGTTGATRQRKRGYAVQLASYSGADAFNKVPTIIREAREQGGVANLWYASNAGQTTVYAGRFRDPDSLQAKATLSRIRNAEINGKTPYEDAKVVALASDRGEALDRRDLRTLKGRNLYTLQVGYYDRNYGTNFRKAAEDRVDVLREQDVDAYYYHGQNRSMVLINAWTYDQAFKRVGNMDAYSNAVRLTQDKYPHNVPNGNPFTEDDDPTFVKTQHSFLVPIR